MRVSQIDSLDMQDCRIRRNSTVQKCTQNYEFDDRVQVDLNARLDKENQHILRVWKRVREPVGVVLGGAQHRSDKVLQGMIVFAFARVSWIHDIEQQYFWNKGLQDLVILAYSLVGVQ